MFCREYLWILVDTCITTVDQTLPTVVINIPFVSAICR